MTQDGRYSFTGLDRVIHERARLGIMTSLMARPDGILFPELKSVCDLTDGNLNRHLKVLSDNDLIETWKSGAGRRRQTLVRITAHGKAQFLRYLAALEATVQDAAEAARQADLESVPQTGLGYSSP